MSLSFPGYLSFQEISYLLWPVDIFEEYYGDFALFQVLSLEPYVEKTFGDKAEEAGFVGIVAGQVCSLFQFEEDVEQPGAIFVEKGFLHDEHIEYVQFSLIHYFGECIRIARIFFCDDFLCFVQILLKVCVFVLATDGFYVVVSRLWKNDLIFCQQIFVIHLGKYGALLLFYIL